ncbi:hypothetical protein SAMN04487928_10417 [Butyrivibrio proteoclasticus]|uniref:Uncharacterized protein n=1 Tax=Butyrivibrio proteoclasticus TaxID=43305 RepID=A0A1I5RGG9_9FIRM|nr:hypothetical protein [Butyrivibrio proteoclasticus]SFP57669.1 hypothetical protein SAMN04487928_10417 [Butyrivibrio proteoclasticus]
MKFDELSPELIEKAQKCENYEERMAFIRENEIELTDDQMEAVNGGRGSHMYGEKCPECKKDILMPTGKSRPGKIFGTLWPDYEYACGACGYTTWKYI